MLTERTMTSFGLFVHINMRWVEVWCNLVYLSRAKVSTLQIYTLGLSSPQSSQFKISAFWSHWPSLIELSLFKPLHSNLFTCIKCSQFKSTLRFKYNTEAILCFIHTKLMHINGLSRALTENVFHASLRTDLELGYCKNLQIFSCNTHCWKTRQKRVGQEGHALLNNLLNNLPI